MDELDMTRTHLIAAKGRWKAVAQLAGLDYSVVVRYAHGTRPTYSTWNRVRHALKLVK